MQFSNFSDPGNGMKVVWAIYLLEWPVFMILAWYLEQVVDSGTGVRRHPLFFLEGICGGVSGSSWGGHFSMRP